MQKRRFRINILDIAIIFLVICAAVALVFRDTINEFFTKPEIVVLEVTVVSESAPENGNTLVLTKGGIINIEAKGKVQAVVAEAVTEQNKTTAVLRLNGYKRFGRFYIENGSPLSEGSGYKAIVGENFCTFSVLKSEISTQ